MRAYAINYATKFKCSVPMTTKETLFIPLCFVRFFPSLFWILLGFGLPASFGWLLLCTTRCVATLYCSSMYEVFRRGMASIHRYMQQGFYRGKWMVIRRYYTNIVRNVIHNKKIDMRAQIKRAENREYTMKRKTRKILFVFSVADVSSWNDFFYCVLAALMRP